MSGPGPGSAQATSWRHATGAISCQNCLGVVVWYGSPDCTGLLTAPNNIPDEIGINRQRSGSPSLRGKGLGVRSLHLRRERDLLSTPLAQDMALARRCLRHDAPILDDVQPRGYRAAARRVASRRPARSGSLACPPRCRSGRPHSASAPPSSSPGRTSPRSRHARSSAPGAAPGSPRSTYRPDPADTTGP